MHAHTRTRRSLSRRVPRPPLLSHSVLVILVISRRAGPSALHGRHHPVPAFSGSSRASDFPANATFASLQTKMPQNPKKKKGGGGTAHIRCTGTHVRGKTDTAQKPVPSAGQKSGQRSRGGGDAAGGGWVRGRGGEGRGAESVSKGRRARHPGP